MIKKLNDKKNNLILQLKKINENKANCKKCNNGVIKENKINALGIDINIKNYCECNSLNGLEYFEIKSLIIKIDNLISNISVNIPVKFQSGCYFSNLDKRIHDFFKSDKLFLWLHGITGNGKTYSLYAIRLNSIVNESNPYNWLNIINESEFSYKTRYDGFTAIDDIGLSEVQNRNISLPDNYYNIINYCLENNKKLILTSNYNVSDWLSNIDKYNSMTAQRIKSRFHNNLEVINLGDRDKRI